MELTDELKGLVRPNIAVLTPYSTARDEYDGGLGIFLDANESPYSNGFNRYPDPHQKALKAKLSSIKGVPVGNIFCGNGSDEAIDLMFRVFCVPGVDNAVAISPSYGMYEVAAQTNDVEMRKVALGEDFSLPVEQLLNACDSHTKLMFICSPNNPSGNAFPMEEIQKLIDGFRGILVVDEAYIDFSRKGTLLADLDRNPRVVVLQTLSKAWAMAGLRLGLAFANEQIINLMSMVKYPYNINQAALDTVLAFLEKPIEEKVETILQERERLASLLQGYSFVKKVYPSDANFLLVKVDDADALYAYLIKYGIIVRNRNRVPGCASCVRITVGLPEENDKLLNALDDYKI